MWSYFFKKTAQPLVINPRIISLLTLAMQCIRVEAQAAHSNIMNPMSEKNLDEDPLFTKVFLGLLLIGCICNCYIVSEERDRDRGLDIENQ